MGADYGGLMIAVTAAVVLGFAMIFVIHKLIDGEIHILAAIPAMWAIIGLLALAIKPPHPILSGVVLVVVVSLMAFFPYAESVLEQTDHRLIDTDKLDRAYRTIIERPDNIPARFEIARTLHSHGFRHEAIAIASTTLEGLSKQVDQVQNRSLRDVFRHEEVAVREWQRQMSARPEPPPRRPCTGCGHVSALHMLACEKCGRPHLLERARSMEQRPKVMGKLLVAWAAIATLLVGGAAIGVVLSGVLRVLAFGAAVAATAAVLTWLFRAPRPR
jgi:hypothetical protein